MQEQFISSPHTQSSLFIRSMSSDPAGGPKKPGWGSKVARQYFAFSIGLCAALIVVPFFIVFIDRLFSNRAPWWLRRHHRTHNRICLVDWWYGWARKKCTTHMRQNWKDTREIISYMLYWRHKTKSYDWCFWDPDGSGAKAYQDRKSCSVLRRVPKWSKICGYCVEAPNGRTCDLEQGRPTILAGGAPNICTFRLNNYPLDLVAKVWTGQREGRHRRASEPVSMDVTKGALPDARGMRDASTARRRSIMRRELLLPQTRNEETNVATSKQLLETRKNYQGLTRGSYKDVLSTRHCSGSPRSNHRTGAINATLKRRSSSDTFASGNLTIAATKCSILPHESQQLLWTTINTGHDLPGSRAPHNSLNSPSTTSLKTSSKLVKYTVQDVPVTILSSRSEQRDLMDVSKLQMGFWRPKPAHKITNQDIYDESYDTTRNPGGSALWCSQNQLSYGHYCDVLSTYELDKSLDEPISQYNSSTSTRSELARLCQYRRLWYHEAPLAANCRLTSEPGKTGNRSRTGAYGSGSDVSHHPTRTMFATAFSYVPPLRRGRAADRGVCVSLFKGPPKVGDRQGLAVCESSESKSHGCSSSTILKRKLPRCPSSLLSLVNIAGSFCSQVGETRYNEPWEYSIPLPGPHELIRREHECPKNHQYIRNYTESVSVHDLVGRLDRLQYELSPGFRGPKSVFCVCWPIDAPMFKPNFQVQLRSRKSTVGSKEKTQNTAAGTFTVAQGEAIKSVNLFGWRTAVNETRTRAGCENITCQPNFPILEKEGFDTAARMLRRPPQGSRSDFGPPVTLYAGTFGRRRTLVEWNAQAAPKGLKRTSAEVDFPEHPAKALRIGSSLVKMVMDTKNNGWFPLTSKPQVGCALTPPSINCRDLPNEIIAPLRAGANRKDQSIRSRQRAKWSAKQRTTTLLKDQATSAGAPRSTEMTMVLANSVVK